MTWFDTWISTSRAVGVCAILILVLIAAATAGTAVRKRLRPDPAHSDSQEGYTVSAVLGLAALLLGFTFSLSVDRFEARRVLVLESANAVGTAYLQTQLLGEPHRSRISDILVRYVDNAIVLARAKPGRGGPLLAKDDQLLTELWQATAPAFDSIRSIDFSSTYVASINHLIDMDGARRAARQAHVPSTVFLVLFCNLAVVAAVLGYVMTGRKGRATAGFLLALMVLSLLLILDIDRPTIGSIRETQAPMEDLRKSMSAWPVGTFDRWRGPPAAAVRAPPPASAPERPRA